MPIFLCYDPTKCASPWTQEKHSSMTNEFAKKRIKYFSIYSPDELEKYLTKYNDEMSSIVFFPATEKERRYLFDRYSKFNINRIIFAHQNVDVIKTNFSYIMSDFYGDMELAFSHLRSKGCNSIALFYPNPGAYHDSMRIKTYKEFAGNDDLIFESKGSTAYPTLEKLMRCDKRIDAIICTTDYVAYYLMLFLDEIDKDWRKKLLVMSFSNSIISSLSSPSLSSISLNYVEGGKEVVTIHRALEKNPRMAYMNIIMKSRLFARETTDTENPSGMIFSEYPFYNYEEVQKIISPQHKCMALEKLLASSDICDLEIMHGLLTGATHNEIATRLYLSCDSIKHRVKKLKEQLKCDSSAKLAVILKKWIHPDRLEQLIIDKKAD